MPGVTRAETKKGVPMPTTTDSTRRTAHLLELMTKGDDLFNTRDWEKLDDVHHPDMIAHIPGSAEPIYGREAHGAAMQQLVRIFPDIRVHTPYPIQFGDGDWITVVTNATGTFTGDMPGHRAEVRVAAGLSEGHSQLRRLPRVDDLRAVAGDREVVPYVADILEDERDLAELRGLRRELEEELAAVHFYGRGGLGFARVRLCGGR